MSGSSTASASRKRRSNGRRTLRVANMPQAPGHVVRVQDIVIGGPAVVVIAGPCSVESREQIITVARAARKSGARLLRGGAFKPRTSPYSFRGLEAEGLRLLAAAKRATGLPIVTEVMDARQLSCVCRYADVLQIGSRNMQNYTLLDEVGKLRMPVLLKRGMSATIKEFLFAAEYILTQGNDQVILCERGIRSFETATRFTLDLNAVPLLKRYCQLPVIVDPSHGTGHAWMVPALARAAVAVGADGIMVEVHPDPPSALSDGDQSLRPEEFDELMTSLEPVAQAVGRYVACAVN